jgi:hypothetical protein
VRSELKDVRSLALQTVEYARRLERNGNELKDDLELLLKSEIMGRLSNFETRLEESIDAKLAAVVVELRQAIAERE